MHISEPGTRWPNPAPIGFSKNIAFHEVLETFSHKCDYSIRRVHISESGTIGFSMPESGTDRVLQFCFIFLANIEYLIGLDFSTLKFLYVYKHLGTGTPTAFPKLVKFHYVYRHFWNPEIRNVEKPVDVCKNTLRLKFKQASRGRNSAYYSNSKIKMINFRLL